MNLTIFFVHVFLATFTLVNAESESAHPSFSTHILTGIGGLWSTLAATTTGEADGTKISSTALTSHTSAIVDPVIRCFAGGDNLVLSKPTRDDNAIRFCESQRDATLAQDFPGISRTYHLNTTWLVQMFQVTWVPKCKAANMSINGDGACSDILRTLGNCKLIAHLLIFLADYLKRRQIWRLCRFRLFAVLDVGGHFSRSNPYGHVAFIRPPFFLSFFLF